MKNKVTIKYIAEALGISISTVSRALHDAYDVSPETRKKVMALAEQLDYNPNPFAVSLVKHETKIIGVLLPEIATPYFSMIVKGIQDVAYGAGYNVMFFISDESVEREKNILKRLSINMLDGLLASMSIETTHTEHFQKLIGKGLPTIFFDRVPDDIATSKVVQDDYHGAYNITEHLIQQGCRRIVHLAGPKHLQNAKLRLQGYLNALEKYDIKPQKQYIIHSGFSQEDGFRDTSIVVGLKPLLDGIFAVNDRKAIGAMLALRRYGFKVPNHVALVSFGNTPIAEVVMPNLTTVVQSAYEIGAKSCQLLFDYIKNPAMEPQTVVMPSQLIIRASSLRGR
jgi:DNA-binding LacI/PurR family transcriptional regulator